MCISIEGQMKTLASCNRKSNHDRAMSKPITIQSRFHDVIGRGAFPLHTRPEKDSSPVVTSRIVSERSTGIDIIITPVIVLELLPSSATSGGWTRLCQQHLASHSRTNCCACVSMVLSLIVTMSCMFTSTWRNSQKANGRNGSRIPNFDVRTGVPPYVRE